MSSTSPSSQHTRWRGCFPAPQHHQSGIGAPCDDDPVGSIVTTRRLTDITGGELHLLEAAMALGIDEMRGGALHLLLRRHRREWLVTTPAGQLRLTRSGPGVIVDEEVHLALSDRLRWFRLENETAQLGLASPKTAILSTSDRSLSIDLVSTSSRPAPKWDFAVSATATLPLRTLLMTLAPTRARPSGLDDQDYPAPPMWLQIDQEMIGFQVDWSDFLPSRSMVRARVEDTSGSATVAIPHQILDAFLVAATAGDSGCDQPITIAIGTVSHGDNAVDALMVAADEWELVLRAVDVLADRWGPLVDDALEVFAVIDRHPTEWRLDVGGEHVLIRLHSGHPDAVRISTHLGSGYHESLELLRELGALNAASRDVRFWLEDDTVRVAADVPCTRLGDLATTVVHVAGVTAGFGPLLATFRT